MQTGRCAVSTMRSPVTARQRNAVVRRQPRYNVVLWDDNDVVQMMQRLFGHDDVRGYEIAEVVDLEGRAICLTTTLEHAELKRDQIHAFGRDREISACKGSMKASIEPVE